jgi:hypothetical protein
VSQKAARQSLQETHVFLLGAKKSKLTTTLVQADKISIQGHDFSLIVDRIAAPDKFCNRNG